MISTKIARNNLLIRGIDSSENTPKSRTNFEDSEKKKEGKKKKKSSFTSSHSRTGRGCRKTGQTIWTLRWQTSSTAPREWPRRRSHRRRTPGGWTTTKTGSMSQSNRWTPSWRGSGLPSPSPSCSCRASSCLPCPRRVVPRRTTRKKRSASGTCVKTITTVLIKLQKAGTVNRKMIDNI